MAPGHQLVIQTLLHKEHICIILPMPKQEQRGLQNRQRLNKYLRLRVPQMEIQLPLSFQNGLQI
jgi:hypothetical protein